jgi:type VI secretion system protein ImpA
VEALLTTRSDAAPSGENLEYEPVFAALELAAQPGEERQVGEEIVPGDPPDYPEVIRKALEVLEQSHDLRAAVHLAVAELKVSGFPGLARVTAYIRGCLEQHWETCHPQLDAEDDDDPTMRVNAVLALAGGTMLRHVRLAPLTRSNAFGRVSLRDIEVSKGETAPASGEERVLDQAGISAAFKDTNSESLSEILAGARAALEDVKAIDAVFSDHTPGQGPELSPLIRLLQRAVTRLTEETGAEVETAAPEGADPGAQTAAPAAQAPVAAAPGAITSQQDVRATIDRIIGWYDANEPSSPVPTVLRRARRLVGADFMTIMKDLAPNGIDNVRLVGGITDEEGG